MGVLERVLAMGITGSGKSYQWLKMAEELLPKGVKFRVLDTDMAIPYMIQTQFPHLDPDKGGNVYVHPAFDWTDYRKGLFWVQQKGLKPEEVNLLSNALKRAYTEQMQPTDWAVIDMADMAWKTVQRYFVTEVFEEDIGDYFLEARKLIKSRGDKDAKGKVASSVMPDALKGWMDWPVINKLYEDWILPLAYRTHCNLFATTKVQELSRDEKDPEILQLYGAYKIRPAGQKDLGHQVHTILLFTPGKTKWFVSTIKDRGGRKYFDKTPLISFYHQYMVAKAGLQM